MLRELSDNEVIYVSGGEYSAVDCVLATGVAIGAVGLTATTALAGVALAFGIVGSVAATAAAVVACSSMANPPAIPEVDLSWGGGGDNAPSGNDGAIGGAAW